MKKLILILPIFVMILTSCGGSGNPVEKGSYAAVTLSDNSHAIVRLEPAVRLDLMKAGDKIHVRKINSDLEVTLFPNMRFLATEVYLDSTGTLRGTSITRLTDSAEVWHDILVVPAVIDSLFRI